MDPNVFIAGLVAGLFIAAGMLAWTLRICGYPTTGKPYQTAPPPPAGGTGKSPASLQGDLDEVCRRALDRWGHDAQRAVAVGEMGELLTMVGRRAQRRDAADQWVDEIADCTIMLRQMALIYGTEAVEARIAEKIKKLRARIEASENVECKPGGSAPFSMYRPQEVDGDH